MAKPRRLKLPQKAAGKRILKSVVRELDRGCNRADLVAILEIIKFNLLKSNELNQSMNGHN